ncbi:hypothetical protein C8Q80DRAFT_281317 [Daedaleopsis nitida]|nr:hypothetical protein C8Q80DRAFT_281317 [Daedaleopsis nitida]
MPGPLYTFDGPIQPRAPLPSRATLRSCSHCGRPEQERNMLRKCGGCESALYCRKECQRRAWHGHKSLCRAVTDIPAAVSRLMNLKCKQLQYGSHNAFAKNKEYFLRAHLWTIEVIARIAAHIHGTDRLVSDPQVLFIVLKRLPGEARSRPVTPTDRLGVKSLHFHSLPDYLSQPDNRRAWDSKTPQRQYMENQFAKHGGPHFATILHTCLYVDDLPSLRRTICFPVYRWAETPVPSELMFRDAQSFCFASINDGFPLRCVLDLNPRIPLPGRFVRRDGCWTWEPLFSSWDEYSPSLGTHKALDDAFALFKSELSPSGL